MSYKKTIEGLSCSGSPDLRCGKSYGHIYGLDNDAKWSEFTCEVASFVMQDDDSDDDGESAVRKLYNLACINVPLLVALFTLL